MCRSLSGCLEAVVATNAVTSQGRMVYEAYDGPVCRNVAIRTLSQRRNMACWF